MSRLSFIDLVFFLTESAASPKHVAGLSIFKKPKGSKAGWVKSFYRELHSHQDIQPPFNHIINFRALGGPSWKEADDIDIDDHLIYHDPGKTMSEQALFEYVAQLHEPLMDRQKPLWEFHIIDKVAGGHFALYTKIHHAYADGMTMSRWMMASMSSSAEDTDAIAVWEQADTGARKRKAEARGMLKSLVHSAKQWRLILLGVSKLMAQLALEQMGLTKNAVALPFKANEDTPLTGVVTSERQIASAHVDMDRIAQLRTTTRCTLNHIALTCVDGALRHYLADHGIELERPISIQMPVNLRDKNDKVSGNKIGMVLVDLAPPAANDPYTRLREIGFTLRAVRNQIDSVPAIAVSQYTGVMAVLIELIQILELHKYLPAISDTLVSNVPGPPQPMYMSGARLEQSLPISTLPPGGQLNITLYSYAGTLYFGLVATDKVANLSSLAGYIEQAFDDLEAAVQPAR
jgi:diacylglycerol O-acyltransferase